LNNYERARWLLHGGAGKFHDASQRLNAKAGYCETIPAELK